MPRLFVHVLPFLLAVLASAASAQSDASHEAERELFRYRGEVYTPDRLSPRMSQLYGALMREHHQELRTLIDEMLFDVHVTEEAARQGRPVLEVGRELLAVDEPSEDAVKRFYEQHKDRIARPFDEVKDQLARNLRREAMIEKRTKLLAELKRDVGFELLARAPDDLPVRLDTRGRPVKGSADAPVTLVKFSDFQCVRCKRAAKLIDELLLEFPDDLRVVYMDFPLNPSGISRHVAYGGVCAAAQGRFWPYHDLAFVNQETLDRDSALAFAEQLSLDLDAFRACLDDRSTRGRVDASFQQGRSLGIVATPTIFVDNRPFVTNHLIRDLGGYIRRKQRESGGG